MLFFPNPEGKWERKENGENKLRKRGKAKRRIDGRERRSIKLERRAKPKAAEGVKIEGKISMKGVVVKKQRRDEKVEDLVVDQRRGVQEGKILRWKE